MTSAVREILREELSATTGPSLIHPCPKLSFSITGVDAVTGIQLVFRKSDITVSGLST